MSATMPHEDISSPRRVSQKDYLETFGKQIAKDIDLGNDSRKQKADAAAARNAEPFPRLERFPISGLAGRSHRGRVPTSGPKNTGWTPPSGRWTENYDLSARGPNSKRVDETMAMNVQSHAFGFALSEDAGHPTSARAESSHLRPLHAKLEQDRQLRRTMDQALARSNLPSSMILFGGSRSREKRAGADMKAA